jgi:hypothetical protein
VSSVEPSVSPTKAALAVPAALSVPPDWVEPTKTAVALPAEDKVPFVSLDPIKLTVAPPDSLKSPPVPPRPIKATVATPAAANTLRDEMGNGVDALGTATPSPEDEPMLPGVNMPLTHEREATAITPGTARW